MRYFHLACVLILGPAVCSGAQSPVAAPDPAQALIDTVTKASANVVSSGASTDIALDRIWNGPVCRSRITNHGAVPVRITEVVLFHIPHSLPPETGLYGEGFTMLSQTAGTLAKPVSIGGYEDAKHYRIPQPPDATTVYELLLLTPPDTKTALFGFTSCRRFVGRFYLRPESIDVVVDTEGLELAAGESWELEEFTVATGSDRSQLLAAFGKQISANHPRLPFDPVPTGWCSWYCFGPAVTATAVVNNLEAIAANQLPLKYIQIDDGYQAAMGDWLDTGKAFQGGIKDVLNTIRDARFEPAIWVGPFIAEENSRVFKEHPEWFIKDDAGQPLRSDKVTFGGWRCGPWYALDGTHPEAQRHLENVFRTMRQEWGCTYFKLDANFWGAMHGGKFHDPKATRVDAYRRGMEAVLRGAGDAFILGCNHPLWPSLGLIHGARSSNDTSRSWESFSNTARETFYRNWQNGLLWWNDPDCILLSGNLPEDPFRFHAAAIYASGGMLLSGDNLARVTPDRAQMLRRLLPPTRVPAAFQDATFRIGTIDLGDKTVLCLFNWENQPQTLTVPLPHPGRIRDFWTGKKLGKFKDTYTAANMPPHSAQLLELTRQ